ncbi:hypothetical protein Vadar_010532 [Vaccinium darrowii]|uniref:Uncharacterized protein n=1 Tax=Vaccinium darrowii TaxID=229202 RepID=A0ACB7Y7E6_9ERIC|nr:hypothetical protein Vadar_010532 [Vaccinium darrowii]
MGDDNASSNSKLKEGLDPSSRYYFHHSDNAVTELCSQLLDSENWATWSRSVEIALSVKNKLGFVTGKFQKPCNSENPVELNLWERVNHMLISWEPCQLQVTTQSCVVFGDELDSYRPLSTCAWCQCGEGSKRIAHHNEDRLMQFLMGLNDTYNPIRGQILLLKPVPDIREAYNMVTQDEKKQEIGNNSLTENFSVAAAVQFPKGSNSNKFSGNPSSFPSNSNNEGLFCKYCKKDTHAIETCYKLHGFPPGHTHHDPNFKPKGNCPGQQNQQHGP